MKYKEVNTEVQRRHEALAHEVELFWAFSDKQFDEGKKKHPLKDGEKYISIASGGFMPKANVQKWIDGLAAIDEYRKSAIENVKADEAILYELNNYECFYSGDISDAMGVLGGLGYTEEQVRTVYQSHRSMAEV